MIQGDRVAVDRLIEHPDVRRSASSAPRQWRAASTSGAPRRASACRRSAAPRTTWSCCPMPTSTQQPTRRCPPPTARPASAAWRSRSLVAVGDVADPLVARHRPTGSPASWSAPGDEPDSGDGSTHHRRAPRQRRRRTSARGVSGRGGPRRRRPRIWRSTVTATSWARRWSTASPPTWRSTGDEVFGPVLAVVRVDILRRGGPTGERPPVRQRHRHLHPRRRGGPALPVRRRGRHGRHERPHPRSRSRTTPSAGGRRRCSATPTSTGRTASASARAPR